MQILAAALIAVLIFLHYLLWLDESGVRQTQTLHVALRSQIQENTELAERNKGLDADVKDLKSGLTALEERARSEMGMIRPDETFYRLLEAPVTHVGSAKPVTTTARKTGAPATAQKKSQPTPPVPHTTKPTPKHHD